MIVASVEKDFERDVTYHNTRQLYIAWSQIYSYHNQGPRLKWNVESDGIVFELVSKLTNSSIFAWNKCGRMKRTIYSEGLRRLERCWRSNIELFNPDVIQLFHWFACWVYLFAYFVLTSSSPDVFHQSTGVPRNPTLHHHALVPCQIEMKTLESDGIVFELVSKLTNSSIFAWNTCGRMKRTIYSEGLRRLERCWRSNIDLFNPDVIRLFHCCMLSISFCLFCAHFFIPRCFPSEHRCTTKPNPTSSCARSFRCIISWCVIVSIAILACTLPEAWVPRPQKHADLAPTRLPLSLLSKARPFWVMHAYPRTKYW